LNKVELCILVLSLKSM